MGETRSTMAGMVAVMACLAAPHALAGGVGVLNGRSHDAASATFTERGLADLGVHLILGAEDPFAAGPDTAAPTIVLIRGYDFAEGTAERVAAYVAGGGKVVLIGPVADEIAEALGASHQPVTLADTPPVAVAPNQEALPGAPESVPQRPTLAVAYGGEGATPLALWHAAGEGVTDAPAIVALPFGAALGWEPQPTSSQRVAWLLAALLGSLDPEIMAVAAQRAEQNFGSIGRLPSWAESQPYLAQRTSGRPAASEALDQATASYGAAIGALQAEDWPTALASALAAQEALVDAYAKCFPSREGEVRAVWCAAAQADWPATLSRLAAANINAIFLEAGTAVTAQYPSQSLMTRPTAADFATIIEQAHAAGLDVHAWHAMLALHDAPPDEIQRYKQEGRVQVSDDGKQTSWLCPSDPRNHEQITKTLTELASLEGLDGIVLDYARYATERECYCDACRKRFEESVGVKTVTWPDDVVHGLLRTRYQGFREAQMGELIRKAAGVVEAAAPGLVVSVTVAPEPQASALGHRTYPDWLADGTIDMVCLLNYRTAVSGLAEQVAAQTRAIGGRALLCVGLAADPRDGPSMDGPSAMEAVAACRQGGADGVALLRYGERLQSEVLPALASGALSSPTLAPYAIARPVFGMPEEPLAREHPDTYVAGEALQVVVELPAGVAIDDLQPVLEDLTTDEAIELAPPTLAEGGAVALTVNPAEGRYRIRVTVPLTDGSASVARSPVFECVSPVRMAAMREEAARARRVDVAVLRDAVGAEAVRRFLSDSGGDIAAEFVSQPTREALAPYDVLVICDVRAPREVLTEEAMMVIYDYAAEGKGVLLLHDAVGTGGLPVLFPSIGGPLANARSTYPEVAISSGRHPAIEGLGAGQRFRPVYGDHVMIQRGALGTPLISDANDSDPDRGTLIVGELLRGRVALCGLGIGLRGDATSKTEAAPRGTEGDLLLSLVRWLGAPSIQDEATRSLRPPQEPTPGGFKGMPMPGMPMLEGAGGVPDQVPPIPEEEAAP